MARGEMPRGGGFDVVGKCWHSSRVLPLQPPDSHYLPAADRRFARLLAAILLLIPIGLFTGCRTVVPRTPEGVVKSEQKVKLTGKEVAVDFYLPQGLKKASVVVVAHGFSRSRRNMAGWGGLLASNGFIVAIPDLPAWSDHERNSLAIRELLDRINSKTLVTEPAPNGGGALMGFSMGGLCTLLAAATNGQVQCWVGLDPVDSGRKGAEAAKQLQIPCAVIQAEPSRCNADGNAKQMVASLSGPLFALRVRGATHTDPEEPTDWLAELVCGKADPDRRAIFEHYTVAVLKSVFFGDAPALATLAAATNDAGVTVLSTRTIKDFKP
jgi:pimeloyl-ACP methyl ester carboxylesterase